MFVPSSTIYQIKEKVESYTDKLHGHLYFDDERGNSIDDDDHNIKGHLTIQHPFFALEYIQDRLILTSYQTWAQMAHGGERFLKEDGYCYEEEVRLGLSIPAANHG